MEGSQSMENVDLENGADESVEVTGSGEMAGEKSGSSSVPASGWGFLWQQLLEELGSARSTEPEENALMVRQLDAIRADVTRMEASVTALQKAYDLFKHSMGAFGQGLYELGIKESEDGLRLPLMECGDLARGISPLMEQHVITGLTKIRDSFQVQLKALEDTRATKETYRIARLALDGAQRVLADAAKSGKNVEAAEAARDAALARYKDVAEALKTKVMLLHQFRIRTLQTQLQGLKSTFHDYFSAVEAKLPKDQTPEADMQESEGAKTKDLAELLAK